MRIMCLTRNTLILSFASQKILIMKQHMEQSKVEITALIKTFYLQCVKNIALFVIVTKATEMEAYYNKIVSLVVGDLCYGNI